MIAVGRRGVVTAAEIQAAEHKVTAAPVITAGPQVELSRRESEILTLRRGGRSSAEIAQMIGLSKGAVSQYLARAQAKLGTGLTGRRAEAVELADAGRTNAEIAKIMGISIGTVEGYLKQGRAVQGVAVAPGGPTLSEQQLRMLRLFAAGLDRAEIAEHLNVSRSVVNIAVFRLNSKYGTEDLDVAIAQAWRYGTLTAAAIQMELARSQADAA